MSVMSYVPTFNVFCFSIDRDLPHSPPSIFFSTVMTQYDRPEEETEVVPLPTEMVGGCLSCLFTYIFVLLLGVCFYDVEASSCQRVIQKKVGDTVELSSCLPTEGVIMARWKYGSSLIAQKDGKLDENLQFKGRLDFNPSTFSLTVRELTRQDSGDYHFVSAVTGKQRGTVTITLKVHEPITKEPVVFFNSTWHPSNESCTALLKCSAPTESNVTYNWTVGNQTITGSSLEYSMRPQDGETKFTCTISNIVSEMSASKTESCSNNTAESSKPEWKFIILPSAVAGGGCMVLIIIVGVAVCVCHRKRSQAAIDSNDLTVYADITDVATEDGTTMKPCTLYETIDNRGETVTSGPQTVYDKIQFNRARKASVSPYQEVS
ncbi:SLAM family member 8-like [Epinephelus fuscoguttatus]|uniref:SLAM family member 8-like n=1 Tax=Epinephelus fuscoguttatus TaxID=293821 RepID=UPI0020D1BDB2|nr:SLAM family member 8-like [Epinephelus fuscoguttatus]